MFKRQTGFSLRAVQPDNFGFGGSLNPAPLSVVPRNTADDNSTIRFNVSAIKGAPNSQEKSDLLGRLFQLSADVDSFLEESRTARLADLSERHDAAVEVARQTSNALALAQQAEFKAMQRWTALDGKAKNAGSQLADAQQNLASIDRALLKRKELTALETHIGGLRQAFQSATLTEDRAFTEYRQLVSAREQAETANHAAVSAATALSGQIDAL